jgi:(1->4)-alpha-D-glucan 1-alpha-D-glucosylmutase
VSADGPVIPRATYRVQLHRGFTFNDARRIVPYLAALGVSHLYASPFLKARSGSQHGYDVVDHEALNPEIGTEEEFEALCAALRAHGMGLMLDLVPNHMGVLKADNAWWLDVLEHGRASRYADYFDIDWNAFGGKVLVPILDDQYGIVLERGDLALRFSPDDGELSLWFYEHRLPIRPASYPQLLLGHIDRVRSGALALRRVADMFARVPSEPGTRSDATQAAAAAKVALAALCVRKPEAAALIAANIERINGHAGDPGSFDALDALIDGQAYRLAYWRVAADDINYRRFFDINDLAALRAEREEVFDATHRRVLDIVARGRADCLRIDHPDGLLDPAGYFERLQRAVRGAIGRDAYVVIEKILAAHERLPPTWPVHGDTGYRFLNAVNALFVDHKARSRFDRLYAAFIGERLDFDIVQKRAKTLIVVHALASDLNRMANALTRIVKRDRHTVDFTGNAIRRALVEVVASFPVYRTYVANGTPSVDDRHYIEWAVAVAKRASTAGETSSFDLLSAVLCGQFQPGDPEVADFVARFQQFTAPAMAKGFEDTSLYIYNRLASLNEVGGDPRAFGSTVGAFHRATLARVKQWPHAMLATSTHDNKRGEDVRARIDVLSEMPAVWRLALRRWRQFNRRHRGTVNDEPAPSRNDEYLFYQTLIGAWPLVTLDQSALDAFRARIQAYMQKAAREAKVHTSWMNVQPEYEAALARFIDGALGPLEHNPFIADFLPLQSRIAKAACVNGLAQTAIKHTSPGVPDTYQGAELWELSLVDPDNRRAVDYAIREAMLRDIDTRTGSQWLAQWEDGGVKLWLASRLLALRKRRAQWFERAGYTPIPVRGTHEQRVCAYLRAGDGAYVLCVVPRVWQAITSEWPIGDAWGDTTLVLPRSLHELRNALTGETCRAQLVDEDCHLRMSDALATFPVGVLESA